MFDDLLVLETEDVESHLGTEEVVINMGKYEIAILKNAHRVDLG